MRYQLIHLPHLQIPADSTMAYKVMMLCYLALGLLLAQLSLVSAFNITALLTRSPDPDFSAAYPCIGTQKYVLSVRLINLDFLNLQ